MNRKKILLLCSLLLCATVGLTAFTQIPLLPLEDKQTSEILEKYFGASYCNESLLARHADLAQIPVRQRAVIKSFESLKDKSSQELMETYTSFVRRKLAPFGGELTGYYLSSDVRCFPGPVELLKWSKHSVLDWFIEIERRIHPKKEIETKTEPLLWAIIDKTIEQTRLLTRNELQTLTQAFDQDLKKYTCGTNPFDRPPGSQLSYATLLNRSARLGSSVAFNVAVEAITHYETHLISESTQIKDIFDQSLDIAVKSLNDFNYPVGPDKVAKANALNSILKKINFEGAIYASKDLRPESSNSEHLAHHLISINRTNSVQSFGSSVTSHHYPQRWIDQCKIRGYKKTLQTLRQHALATETFIQSEKSYLERLGSIHANHPASLSFHLAEIPLSNLAMEVPPDEIVPKGPDQFHNYAEYYIELVGNQHRTIQKWRDSELAKLRTENSKGINQWAKNLIFYQEAKAKLELDLEDLSHLQQAFIEYDHACQVLTKTSYSVGPGECRSDALPLVTFSCFGY